MKKIILIAGLFILLGTGIFFYYYGGPLEPMPSVVVPPTTSEILSTEQRYPHTIQKGSTLAASLQQLDISSQDIFQIVTAAKSIKDLGRLNAGTRFQIFYSEIEPTLFTGIRIKLSPLETLIVQKIQDIWTAEKLIKKVDVRVVTFKGNVLNSLWESAVEAKMNPTLISELAEIFAWQVDFGREVQSGDRWRLSVEEELVNGEHIGWGSILSAEFTNANGTFTAILFRKDKKDIGYFSLDGSSLKRIFLKNPIQYARISSRFQKSRFHPVLKIARPHHGVDYAAPTGTPIRVVGDGTIVSIGRNLGAGNTITVRHNATYTTSYKHMSRFAKGMKNGSRVQQGQTIGYVGSTGLATGPHLHFEFFVNGRYVDPLGQKFPTAEPVPQSELAEFLQVKDSFLAQLPSWDQSVATDGG